MIQELIQKIDALEYRLDTLSKPEYKPGLKFVLADKDGDGDFDPLTSTDWDGDAKNGNGTIDWNAVFGVPSYAKAVQLLVHIKDGTIGTYILLKAKSTTISPSLQLSAQVANQYHGVQGTVPIAAAGTSYWTASAAIDEVYIRVVGWFV